ncbi:MAG: SufD family Fe-S cluster assembly protein [Pseudomonadota bacterium]
MTTHAIRRPTRKDEAWRYADFGALDQHWPESADHWREIEVGAGETACETLVMPNEAGPVSAVERLRIHIADHARFELYAIAARGHYARLEIEAHVGEGAHFEFGGAIIGAGASTNEFVMDVRHLKPGGTSNQTVRAIMADKAVGSFLGGVHVARDAQRIDGSQSAKAMLLDRGATANLKPQLEIYADDVKCAHGATVGELDRQALFYMASRGIPPELAERLILQTFVAEAFAALTADEAREALEAEALAMLEGMK